MTSITSLLLIKLMLLKLLLLVMMHLLLLQLFLLLLLLLLLMLLFLLPLGHGRQLRIVSGQLLKLSLHILHGGRGLGRCLGLLSSGPG